MRGTNRNLLCSVILKSSLTLDNKKNFVVVPNAGRTHPCDYLCWAAFWAFLSCHAIDVIALINFTSSTRGMFLYSC